MTQDLSQEQLPLAAAPEVDQDRLTATRETLEDYTLRFAPRSYRKWSTRVVGISALGGILGGPAVGMAVGLTGGLHRYSLGGFTASACAVSTTVEGLIGGCLHLYLLRRHRADDTVSRAIARVLRADLVVVDDIGLLPVAADAAEGLYRLVDAAYEKRSVAISSNLHPSGFDELMPKTLATATVDRLLHHAHVCQTSGDSVRLTQALAGQGVSPLN